ncbi:MAG: hypothetical protein EA412_06295 [Chitinophagaceae bacterium]|nr:MAG: hypothetical protein EA412_06295 [Chitinophagaceae bacterium]
MMKLNINLNEWVISNSKVCTIVNEYERDYEIQNKNGLISTIPKAIIEANELSIVNGSVTLSEGVYEHYVVHDARHKSQKLFNDLFSKHAAHIFKNKSIVLSRAEYYLLRPGILVG